MNVFLDQVCHHLLLELSFQYITQLIQIKKKRYQYYDKDQLSIRRTRREKYSKIFIWRKSPCGRHSGEKIEGKDLQYKMYSHMII